MSHLRISLGKRWEKNSVLDTKEFLFSISIRRESIRRYPRDNDGKINMHHLREPSLSIKGNIVLYYAKPWELAGCDIPEVSTVVLHIPDISLYKLPKSIAGVLL